MGIHPRRLRDLTEEVDQPHHESMRTSESLLTALPPGTAGTGPARRSFLKQVAVGGAALTVASQVGPFEGLLPAAWGQEGEDEAEGAGETDPALEFAAFAASVELAAAGAYRSVVDTGLLTEPVAELARAFGSHHSAHADALNAFLAEPITEPNPGLVSEVASLLSTATDEESLLTVALGIEEAMAATHHTALGTLDAKTATAVATVLPVEAQHAVTLAALLGPLDEQTLPPVQESEGALDPEQYPLTSPEGTDPESSTTTTVASGGGGEEEGDGGSADAGSGAEG